MCGWRSGLLFYSLIVPCRPKDATSKPYAELSFGFETEGRCDSVYNGVDLVYVPFPNSDNGILALPIDYFFFADYQSIAGGNATLNLGQPVTLFPNEIFTEIHKRIQPDYNLTLGVYTIDCRDAGRLQPWTFQINRLNYTIPSKTYIYDVR